MEDGAFPVVLSGSCFAGVGVVAGLAEPAPAVVWFDAHADFNTPDTSISGYFDGMGLAVLTGGAWQAMHARVPDARPVPESAVILAGARDFDPPEVRRLEASAVTHLRPEELGGLAGALAAITPAPSGVYLHVDLDVLDIGRGPRQRLRRRGRPERGGARGSDRHGLPRVAGAGALADGVRPRLRPRGPGAADRARPASRPRRLSPPRTLTRRAARRGAGRSGRAVDVWMVSRPRSPPPFVRARAPTGADRRPARARHRPGTATRPRRRRAS